MNDNKDFKIGQIRGKAGLAETYLKNALKRIEFESDTIDEEVVEDIESAIKEIQEIHKLSKQI